MATSISIRHYVGIYIYETYIYKMSASVPREDDTELPWGPKGPIERNVINIRIYIYNKSPLRISFPGGAAPIGSLELKKWSKISLSIFDYF